jgi:hypothetical protein
MPPPSRRLARLLGALVPALILGAVALAFALIRSHPLGLARALALGALVAVLSWIVTSVLWPARADRRCPACGADSLVRKDPRATVGIACARCGYADADASAWLFAEEEGPLERTVLEERAARRRGREPGDVDIPPLPD